MSQTIATKHEQEPATYDRLYQTGGYRGIYHLPYRQSPYYLLFRHVVKQIRARRHDRVLEAGCGNGAFAEMLLEKTTVDYRGFDFSPVGVEQSQSRTGRKDAFFVSDARTPDAYRGAYDCVVCLEVLEHIEEDMEVISQWKPGVTCYCSVPSFDSAYHVRHFESKQQVIERYGSSIDIETVIEQPLPGTTRLSWRAYTRAVLQNIGSPNELLRIAGIRRSGRFHGWYLLVGTRRPPSHDA